MKPFTDKVEKPHLTLFHLADALITQEGKHVFLKILCDHLSKDEALALIDEINSFGL